MYKTEPYVLRVDESVLTPLELEVKKNSSMIHAGCRSYGKTIMAITTHFVYWFGEEASKEHIKKAIESLTNNRHTYTET